uniref:Intraflagellar transport 88 n=1 Tax=Suricata suricatta TaxID=37032 RepID=A0A673SQD0_SURSU
RWGDGSPSPIPSPTQVVPTSSLPVRAGCVRPRPLPPPSAPFRPLLPRLSRVPPHLLRPGAEDCGSRFLGFRAWQRLGAALRPTRALSRFSRKPRRACQTRGCPAPPHREELENDTAFQQAVRTSHGRRPPITAKIPSTAVTRPIATGYGSKTSLASSMGRPMTGAIQVSLSCGCLFWASLVT